MGERLRRVSLLTTTVLTMCASVALGSWPAKRTSSNRLRTKASSSAIVASRPVSWTLRLWNMKPSRPVTSSLGDCSYLLRVGGGGGGLGLGLGLGLVLVLVLVLGLG